ncbi:MAG: hypothetical protein F4Y47_07210 [Acidobacteriia bacterium]|nr:hypothetical protein [Terriglobia bacterium]MYK11595.1 hypothetical protein [Terriglobia bacterium]
MTPRTRLILPLLALLATAPVLAQESVLMRAMRDELQRSMSELQLRDMSKPYFVSYQVHETTSARATASLGAIVGRSEGAGRLLSVEVRVGDASFDNTNLFTRPEFGSALSRAGFPTTLPLEDDYGELRRKIWLATDNAYKQALDHLSKKRAVLQNATQVEQVPDFSVQEPLRHGDARPLAEISVSALEALALEVSAGFRGLPHVSVSEVEVEAASRRVSYVNSEGTSFTRLDPAASVQISAGTQGDDGTTFEDSTSVHARVWERLPGRAELLALAADLAQRLQQLRAAPVLDRYTGPVLFEGQAAAEVVRQVLVPRLLAVRVPIADDSRFARAMERAGNPFVDKLGSRVLPRFLDVVDDPTRKDHEQVALLGGYAIDDEGVAARQTALIQRGILKTLLSTRNPVQGVPASSGHRRGGGPAPSNLFVVPRQGLAPDDLRSELLSLVEERELEFGMVVRRVGNAAGRISRGRGPGSLPRSGERSEIAGAVAYKLFADGREELVGKVVLAGMQESDFRDIVAASEASAVHTARFLAGSGSALGFAAVRRPVVVSLVVPSLLFEDVTIRRPSGNIPRPPLLPHPLAGG